MSVRSFQLFKIFIRLQNLGHCRSGGRLTVHRPTATVNVRDTICISGTKNETRFYVVIRISCGSHLL